MAEYSPEIRETAMSALAKMRRLIPGAVELVYDNYNALVIGFGATERASEAVCSLALYPRWVTLFLLQGAKVPDPARRLSGSGKSVRSVVLQSANDLDDAEICDLIAHAVARSRTPFDPSRRNRLIIRSISPKRRPRRPAS